MALREPYSLVNSKFNDFLFAPVGDEGNGMTLSVFSALTRLDIDPWREAERLSDLSKEKAAQAFASIIARLPGGRWTQANTQEIAARLVAFLPRRNATTSSTATAVTDHKSRPKAVFLVIALVLYAVAFFVTGIPHQVPQHNDGTATETSKTDSQP